MQSGGLLERGAGSLKAARTAYEDGHYKTTVSRAYHAANQLVVCARRAETLAYLPSPLNWSRQRPEVSKRIALCKTNH